MRQRKLDILQYIRCIKTFFLFRKKGGVLRICINLLHFTKVNIKHVVEKEAQVF